MLGVGCKESCKCNVLSRRGRGSCYYHLSAVAQDVAVDHYPNTGAVAREIANGNVSIYNKLTAEAKACITRKKSAYSFVKK